MPIVQHMMRAVVHRPEEHMLEVGVKAAGTRQMHHRHVLGVLVDVLRKVVFPVDQVVGQVVRDLAHAELGALVPKMHKSGSVESGSENGNKFGQELKKEILKT